MKPKVMVLGTYVNAPYHPFQPVDRVLSDLLSPDFSVTITDDPRQLFTLKEYAALISYLDAFDQSFPDQYAECIHSFVQKGGGLLCLHNGISLQTNQRLSALIGGRFLHHPKHTVLRFTPDPSGILCDEKAFEIDEEPYQFEMSDPLVQPLLYYRYENQSCLGGWCRTEEKGRVAFLTPGHSAQTFYAEAYKSMIMKSVCWLARSGLFSETCMDD